MATAGGVAEHRGGRKYLVSSRILLMIVCLDK